MNAHPFNGQAFLRGEVIFSQGDACTTVMYIQKGGVKLSVLSKLGREAVLAILGPGDFFGEGCLAGQPFRMGSAAAITASTILLFEKDEMIRQLHDHSELADRFITHMLGANIRIEEDLINQLFDHDEKRLARTLLLLARYGTQDNPQRVLPQMSQQKLAKLAGVTREKVDFFLKKFKRLGFIENVDRLTVDKSLLSVVLHE